VIGSCGIPSTAVAASVNVTVVGSAAPGHLTLYPGDPGGSPLTGRIDFSAGQARSNNATVRLFRNGAAIVVGNGSEEPVHLVIDVTGYFQ
jgi:hypothetical protein